MRVSLPGNLDRYIADQIDSGRFATADQMIAAALEAMQHHDALRADLQIGVNQVEQGDCVTIEGGDQLATFGDEVKARGRERLKQSH